MALSLLNDNPVDEPNGHLLHKYLRRDQSRVGLITIGESARPPMVTSSQTFLNFVKGLHKPCGHFLGILTPLSLYGSLYK